MLKFIRGKRGKVILVLEVLLYLFLTAAIVFIVTL
jgi:hypothetical protein